MLDTVTLGDKTGLKVPKLCLGTMNLELVTIEIHLCAHDAVINLFLCHGQILGGSEILDILRKSVEKFLSSSYRRF